MDLRLYNTLTKREEVFEPIDPAKKSVTFYSCGPTVYDFAHIGNFRSFLNADVLRRTLELLGYTVRHVMNITDVGHMTDDANADGAGEDKMQAASRRLLEAKKSGKLPADVKIDPTDPYAIANFYADAFLEDARTLGLKIAFEEQQHPELMPRPTKYIAPMIEMVKSLIAHKHAYVAKDGVVYFDVQSFPEYGRLSGNTPDSIRAGEGGRVDEANQAMKKHPADFMLWKADPKHVMKWDSPWGEGYPGWHLECSVMAKSLLGDEIDLHSGGEDNIFPHHECEIAQTCSFTGRKAFARFWFHTRHLIVEGEKMSKSKGNFFTVRDLIAKGASPAAIRLEIIKTHYRSNANFTFQGLNDSQRMIDRWGKVQAKLQEANSAKTQATTGANGTDPLAMALLAFKASLCGDLNIAGAIGVLNEAVGRYNLAESLPPDIDAASELNALESMNSVLGVLDLQREKCEHLVAKSSTSATVPPAPAAAQQASDDWVEHMLAHRNHLRNHKDWKAGDAVRDTLKRFGIEIKDGPTGTTWTRVTQ